MDTSSLDSNMVTLMAMIAGSWLTIVALMIRQSNRHEDSIKALDTKVTGRIDALDTKFTTRIDALDTKFTARIDALGCDVGDVRERLARVEGHLMAPEGFTLRRRRPPSEDDPPSEAPGPSQREAG